MGSVVSGTMRILVLGGTSFVGRAIVDDALREGAEVTLFGRGRTGTELFPGVPRRIGDRDTGDYAALRDGSWDAVVDVSGYVPRHVGQAMEVLGDRIGDSGEGVVQNEIGGNESRSTCAANMVGNLRHGHRAGGRADHLGRRHGRPHGRFQD